MNTRRQMLTACLAALAWPRLLQARPDTALVIQDGSLFDPASMKLMPIQAVVITGEKITAVGTPQKPVPLPTGARVIDAKGKFLLPGLIDAHVHLVHRLNFAHVTGDEVLPLFLAHGVTSVRDTGDEIVAHGHTNASVHAFHLDRQQRCGQWQLYRWRDRQGR